MQHQTEQSIYHLVAAVNHFKKRFPHTLYSKVSLYPKYEKLGPQYYEKEMGFDDKENEFDMVVKKQDSRVRNNNSSIARILVQDITNGLGIMDTKYYCVIFRKKWLNHWASSLDNDKYRSSSGIFIPFHIIEYIRENKLQELTTLVVVMGDGSIHTAKITDIMKFIFKLKIFLFINQYSQMMTGVPKELFREEI